MQKPWLRHYPEGVPQDISTENYTSLVDLLNQACQRHAARPALTFMGKSLSYAELDQQADAVAAWLLKQNLPKGSRVGLMMPNVMAYVVVLLGVLRAGLVVVNINPLYTAHELEYQLSDSQIRMMFLFEAFAATLDKVPAAKRPDCVALVSPGDLMGVRGWFMNALFRYRRRAGCVHRIEQCVRLAQVLNEGANYRHEAGARFSLPDIAMDDLAVLQYTGGTTGLPKGAMLSHRNLVANVLQVQAVATPVLGSEGGAGMVIMTALPLYHIFALTVCGLFAMHAGMNSILIADPRKLNTVIGAWKKHPVSIFPSVNTLFNGLLRQPDFARLDFSALRLCFGGGSAVQKAVADRWQQLTGLPIIEGYGLSETSPVALVNPTNATHYSGDIGFPLPSTDVKIINERDEELPYGEAGEIVLAGPQVMKGYWQRPRDTAAVFTADGYLRTGDIGIMSAEGRVRIIDRKKDMILVSGFNVYPNEIEQVVAEHPGVRESVAVGLPSETTGEMVKLFVVKADSALTAEDLQQWVAQRLTNYKHPHAIEFRDELPKSNAGKLLRRVLRDEELGQGQKQPTGKG